MISMKIGIISDSHDDITNVNKAIEIFEEMNVESIIHAGDIISPPIIKEFKKLTEDQIRAYGKNNHVLYDIKYLLKANETDGRL